MNQFYDQVTEFNSNLLKFIQPTSPEPLSDEVLNLTLVQLREEIDELEEAHTATEQVDALIDNIYFALGALYKIGLNSEQFDACTTAIHTANMTKVTNKKANRAYSGNEADAAKPDDFVSPEEALAGILNDSEFLGEYDGV